jgi:hypothetical protein
MAAATAESGSIRVKDLAALGLRRVSSLRCVPRRQWTRNGGVTCYGRAADVASTA